jgi:hypothetical protein
MADVRTEESVHIDHYLDYLFDEFSDLSDLAAEWPALEAGDRSAFREEWGIKQDRLGLLRRYAEQGCMTPEQAARYAELLALVTRMRPLLATLFEGW